MISFSITRLLYFIVALPSYRDRLLGKSLALFWNKHLIHSKQVILRDFGLLINHNYMGIIQKYS